MKRYLIVYMLVTFCWVSGVGASSLLETGPQQQPPAAETKAAKPQYEMTTHNLALLLRGPNPPANPDEGTRLRNEHIKYLRGLQDNGKVVIFGPLTDGGDLQGIVVFSPGPIDDANTLMGSDPFVKAGVLKVEMRPWFSAKGIMKKPDWSGFSTYYITFLRRAPNPPAESTSNTQSIMAGHMANIQKMADDGHLVIAGPMADKGDLRGVFVFRVSTLEQARALSNADPAVKAGLLVADVHPWMLPKGSLP